MKNVYLKLLLKLALQNSWTISLSWENSIENSTVTPLKKKPIQTHKGELLNTLLTTLQIVCTHWYWCFHANLHFWRIFMLIFQLEVCLSIEQILVPLMISYYGKCSEIFYWNKSDNVNHVKYLKKPADNH